MQRLLADETITGRTKKGIMNDYKTDIEYYGQCEHLDCMDIESDECLKRYFLVYDYKRLKRYRLAVCNDHLKLLLHTRRNDSNRWMYKKEAHDVIYDLICKHTGVDSLANWNRECKFPVGLPVCERPFVYKHVSFFSALNMLFEATELKDWNIGYEIRDTLLNGFSSMKEYMTRYAKYKSSWTKLNKIEKRIKESMYSTKVEKLELLTELMDLMVKYKINKL
jgi:hypothetical protein